MQTPRRLLLAAMCLTAGTGPLVLAWALPASRRENAVQTPQQVADTLDGIVQPRFQKNAGRFGVDRIYLDGHNNTYEVEAENAGERRKFQQVNQAHRPYVIAFLHCAHKPGHDALTRELGDAETHPFVQVLTAVTGTDDGSSRLWEWGDANLDKAALPALSVLRQGDKVSKDFGNWRVVLRPVRAEQSSCLGCHSGARHGDTLGVMVYAVDKNTISLPLKSTIVGEP